MEKISKPFFGKRESSEKCPEFPQIVRFPDFEQTPIFPKTRRFSQKGGNPFLGKYFWETKDAPRDRRIDRHEKKELQRTL
jgi:hypothetical protein